MPPQPALVQQRFTRVPACLPSRPRQLCSLFSHRMWRCIHLVPPRIIACLLVRFWEIYLQAGLLRGGRLPFLRPCRRPSSSSCTVLGGRSFTMCDWSVIRVNRRDGPWRHLEPNRPVCWLSMTVLHSPALSFLQARWLWLDLKLHGSA
jgi:hypothetical protein